jgi:hypothetical protein
MASGAFSNITSEKLITTEAMAHALASTRHQTGTQDNRSTALTLRQPAWC